MIARPQTGETRNRLGVDDEHERLMAGQRVHRRGPRQPQVRRRIGRHRAGDAADVVEGRRADGRGRSAERSGRARIEGGDLTDPDRGPPASEAVTSSRHAPGPRDGQRRHVRDVGDARRPDGDGGHRVSGRLPVLDTSWTAGRTVVSARAVPSADRRRITGPGDPAQTAEDRTSTPRPPRCRRPSGWARERRRGRAVGVGTAVGAGGRRRCDGGGRGDDRPEHRGHRLGRRPERERGTDRPGRVDQEHVGRVRHRVRPGDPVSTLA